METVVAVIFGVMVGSALLPGQAPPGGPASIKDTGQCEWPVDTRQPTGCVESDADHGEGESQGD